MDNIKFGWLPDSVDKRDYVMRFSPSVIAAVPPKVDLLDHCSPVENQAALGSCSANAAAGALEFLELRDGVAKEGFENFSRLFIYYNARDISMDVHVDSGVSIRDTLTSLEKIGVCDELVWPYDITAFSIKPER